GLLRRRRRLAMTAIPSLGSGSSLGSPLAQRRDLQFGRKVVELPDDLRKHRHAALYAIVTARPALLAGQPDGVEAGKPRRRPQIAKLPVDLRLERPNRQ